MPDTSAIPSPLPCRPRVASSLADRSARCGGAVGRSDSGGGRQAGRGGVQLGQEGRQHLLLLLRQQRCKLADLGHARLYSEQKKS